MAKAVTALFSDHQHAQMAIEELKEMGHGDDLTVVAKDNTTNDVNIYKVDEVSNGSGLTKEGDENDAVKGAVTGGLLGGIVGLLAAVAAFTVPGGVVIAAGPLAATLGLTGAVTGAALGGIVGALMDMGVSEDRAKMYQENVERGEVLVAVNTKDDETQEALDVFNKHGAHETDVLNMAM